MALFGNHKDNAQVAELRQQLTAAQATIAELRGWVAQLTSTKDTISRLGALMRIVISEDYHRPRLREIDLTTDYLARIEAEREEARAERERLREEAKVLKEIERERARLAKERAHYVAVVAKLETNGDPDALARAKEQLAEVDDAVAGVEQRAANVRAGYVY